MRKILLIEPNYKNKYPPLGLMKISAYHKKLGDTVIFFKGDEREYIFDEKKEKCFSKIRQQRFDYEDLDYLRQLIYQYLKQRTRTQLYEILELIPFEYRHTVENILNYFAHDFQPEKKWDRIYITTLFTFYWKQTKKSIEFAKRIVKSIEGLFVGGVAASLIRDIISKETGLQVGKNIITGLLDRPGILDDNDMIIDELIPDYSILEISNYKYPLDTGYLTYMTKGCTRKCEFCAVPELEPVYKEMISFKDKINVIRELYGERKDLILMDNNVLCSPKFEMIIEEIKEMGFVKNAKFVEPNHLMILIQNLKNEKDQYNQEKYLTLIYNYLIDFGTKRILNPDNQQKYFSLLHERKLDVFENFDQDNLNDSFEDINQYIEKYRNKSAKNRNVDFNQGIDCRYLDEEKIKLLSQLPIRPMRIAFDYYSLRKQYEKAIRLAAQYDIKHLSNYILYNNSDKPENFWKRLKLNIDLNQELNIRIFSFPMKFVPLSGKASLDRSFIGKYWNPKYLRAIQSILNVTKGIVMPGKSFFEKAFGRTIDEFIEILILPDPYILYRLHFEEIGRKDKWLYQYKNFNKHELAEADIIINSNCFDSHEIKNKAVAEFIKEHYQFKYKPPKKK